MDFYSNFILIIAILLLLNIWFFDKSRNAGIGFRTKRSTSSEKKWVYSQTIFYGGVISISLLSSTLYSFNVIDVSMSNLYLLLESLFLQLLHNYFLRLKRSQKIIKSIMPFSTGIITSYKCIANVKPAVLIVLEKLLSEQLFYVRMN